MPDNKEVQQQRQQAIAMQAELAKSGTKAPATPGAPVQPGVPAAPDAGGQIEQAQQLVRQGNFAGAVSRLNETLAGDPHNEAALRLRSLAYMRLGRLAEARKDLDELVKLKPND